MPQGKNVKKQEGRISIIFFFKSHFLASSRFPEPSSVDETAGSGNSLWALRGTENCGDKSRGASEDAESRRATCRREWWRATITGTMCGSERRGRRAGSCYHKLCCERGNKVCVSWLFEGGGGVAGSSADTSTAWEMLQQSRWGGELSGGKNKNKKRREGGWIRKLEVRKNPC